MYHTSHILKRLKWIEKHLNVTPEWNLFGTGPAIIEAFKLGSIDIGYIGLPPAIIGIGKRIGLKCVAGGHVEGTVLIGKQGCLSSEEGKNILPALKQFEGRKIGSPAKGSIHDVIIRFLIKKHGLNNVDVKNYPWADLIPDAINEGEIHGAVGTPPLAVLAKKWYGHCIVIPPSFIWPFNPSYGIVVKEDISGKKNILEDFLILHEKACNLIIQKPEEAAQAVAEELKVVDKNFILEVFAVSPRYCASVPEEYIGSAMKFIPVLQDLGYLENSLTREDIFDLSFIKNVHPEPHHYLQPLNI
jgi:NitT/TauT family transport system substrate-binding protein